MSKRTKNREGFSLVTVLSFAAIAAMLLSAIMLAILPVYERASQSRYYSIARTAAETGIDYTVSQLNAAIQQNNISALDDPTVGPPYTVTTLPGSITGPATVTVTVENIAMPKTAYGYDTTRDPNNAASGLVRNDWRVIEATAQYGVVTRNIRVILRPGYLPNPASVTSPNPYFQGAAQSAQQLTLNGYVSTDGYNSSAGPYSASKNPLGGNLITNTGATLSGTSLAPISIGGNLTVDNQGAPNSPVAITAPTEKQFNVVENQLTLNGIYTGYGTATPGFVPSPTNPPPGTGTYNVLGLGLPRGRSVQLLSRTPTL